MKTPIVLTLDAGGTNFVFSAIQDEDFITSKVTLPALAHDLNLCINQLFLGFESVLKQLREKPVAISFSFPGPADYPNGIIGGFLPNFPSFREGVALKRILENRFKLPVFINNDADLFTYGEATHGRLPEINMQLKQLGSTKTYHNMLGYTFGTGFGFGFVSNGHLHIGDNSCVETFCLRHKTIQGQIAESGVSARAIVRVYNELSHANNTLLTPKDVFDIAEGNKPGDASCAKESFRQFGETAGDAIATAASLIDGIVVIGGGITAASKYIMPAILKEMRGTLKTIDGESVRRVQMDVYDLDNEEEFQKFACSHNIKLKVWGSDEYVDYDPIKRIGVTISRNGAAKSISLGAAKYALNHL